MKENDGKEEKGKNRKNKALKDDKHDKSNEWVKVVTLPQSTFYGKKLDHI